MNLIKLIFIILFFQGLRGQPISTPQMIKPAVILDNIDENSIVTFIAFEEFSGEYKTAKGYSISKNNNLIARPEIFSWTLDLEGASFFSGAHYKDITGEGDKELIILITNPQTGTHVRSWTLGPGYNTKKSVHEPYYIKTKQKASEAVSSLADIVYADKDYEIAICFGSPERKIVLLDYQGEMRSKTIGKKFLENNVGPIELKTADFNRDGMKDIYILSNGAIKEENIYYSTEFKEGNKSTIKIKEKIRDILFYLNPEGETKKILLLKNETIYVKEWEKYFSTEEKKSHKIIGQKEQKIYILNKQGDVVVFAISEENKTLEKETTIKNQFQNKNFNKLEYLFIDEKQVLISHNKNAEIIIQNIGETNIDISKNEATKTKEFYEKPQKEEPKEAQEMLSAADQINVEKKEKEGTNKDTVENITIHQDSLLINVGESKEIKISLGSQRKFLNLEKIQGPPNMILDKSRLAFLWTPTDSDVGTHKLKYRATYNVSDEYEIYFEDNIEKLRPKQDLQTTEHSLSIYVNAEPTIKISNAEDYIVSANQEIVIPIYVNDQNADQTLLITRVTPNIKNASIENRKFFWTPANEDYGQNTILFSVTDGFLENFAKAQVFVDTVKTEIKFDKQLITTVNNEFVYKLPISAKAKTSIVDSPENVRISKDGAIHWIPTKPQLEENQLTIEIKEPDQTYLYNMSIFVNAPPVISFRPDDTIYMEIGDSLNFTMRSFEENENQKHFWSIKEKPETMQLSNSTIKWVANEPDYHPYHIELSDTIDTDDFFGQIYVNDIPKIISTAPNYVALGDTFVYKIQVDDKNTKSPYNNSLENQIQYFLKTFPLNMSLEEKTIIWIPTEKDVGQHYVEFEVYDGISKDEQEFSLLVNDVPTIISSSHIKIAVGEEMHHFVKAKDSNDFNKLTFAINSNLDEMFMNTKTGEILWTPTESDLGNQTIEVSVSDGFDLSKDIQKINIFVYKNPRFLDATLPEAYAGVEYNHTIKAEDMYNKNISEIDVFVEMQEATFKEASFDKLNYNLKIIPTFEEIGTQYISFSLEDNYNNKTEENFPIKVLSSPCETSDTLYVNQEEVINKLQKIDKSIVYTSKNEKLNVLSQKEASPDTIFITKYDTTITNITDSIFVTINSPEEYIKENTKLTKREKRRAERKAARFANKTKKAATEQKPEEKEKEKEPLVITTQHKNINIINKETVVVEQIVSAPKETNKQEDEAIKEEQNTTTNDLGHSILGIKTPKEDKLQKHLFGQKSIEKNQKTEHVIPDFIDQPMYWHEEKN